jgi:hypothetical protein
VNSVAELAALGVPVAFVAVTGTAPMTPAGATTVQVVSEVQTMSAPGIVPKSMLVVLDRSEPVMVTVAPPPVDPEAGEMVVMVAGASGSSAGGAEK